MNEFPHKEIADTFFNKSAASASKKKKRKKWRNLPIFAASILLLILLLILIGVSVDIKNSTVKTRLPARNVFPAENIMKKGRLNYSKIKQIYFDGDAKEKSSFLNLSVKLVNSGGSGGAYLIIVFKKSIDLSGKSLLISAKTDGGKKGIKLILKDVQGRSYQSRNIRFSPDWALEYVGLNKKSNFDLKRVEELKIAFGAQDTGNPQNSVIYIKDITIISSSRGAV